MGLRSRRIALVATAAVASTAAALTSSVLPVGAAPATITRSAHVPYEGCPASQVRLTASIQGGTFEPGQLVTYQVTVHNLGDRSCGYTQPESQHGLAAPGSMLLGPCAPLSVDIENAQGVDLYPGVTAIGCPAYLGPAVAAHGTLHATGTWDQQPGIAPAITRLGNGGQLVAPGRYHVILAGKVTLPITIAAPTP